MRLVDTCLEKFLMPFFCVDCVRKWGNNCKTVRMFSYVINIHNFQICSNRSSPACQEFLFRRSTISQLGWFSFKRDILILNLVRIAHLEIELSRSRRVTAYFKNISIYLIATYHHHNITYHHSYFPKHHQVPHSTTEIFPNTTIFPFCHIWNMSDN
jgi:hypothetical protein